jgi:hypothetical protein
MFVTNERGEEFVARYEFVALTMVGPLQIQPIMVSITPFEWSKKQLRYSNVAAISSTPGPVCRGRTGWKTVFGLRLERFAMFPYGDILNLFFTEDANMFPYGNILLTFAPEKP